MKLSFIKELCSIPEGWSAFDASSAGAEKLGRLGPGICYLAISDGKNEIYVAGYPANMWAVLFVQGQFHGYFPSLSSAIDAIQVISKYLL